MGKVSALSGFCRTSERGARGRVNVAVRRQTSAKPNGVSVHGWLIEQLSTRVQVIPRTRVNDCCSPQRVSTMPWAVSSTDGQSYPAPAGEVLYIVAGDSGLSVLRAAPDDSASVLGTLGTYTLLVM